jgi:tRNA(adenine34) deaminase
MGLALEQADHAYKLGEVPVGAVVVSSEGKIISQAHNLKETTHAPCSHAEILALNSAGKELQNWRLLNCTLVVTLEPCLMCLSAMVHARIKQLVFGAYDPKAGALSLGYRIHDESKLNHRFSVVGGWNHYESSRLLSRFFKERRMGYQPN